MPHGSPGARGEPGRGARIPHDTGESEPHAGRPGRPRGALSCRCFGGRPAAVVLGRVGRSADASRGSPRGVVAWCPDPEGRPDRPRGARPSNEPPPDRFRARDRTDPAGARRRTTRRPGDQRHAAADAPPTRPRRTAGRPPPAGTGTRTRPATRRSTPAGRAQARRGSSPSLRWVPWIVLALIAAAFLVSSLASSTSSKAELTYSQFVQPGRRRQRQEHRVQQVDRRDQRRVRRPPRTARRSSRARARRTTSRHAARARSRSRTSTSNYVDTGSNIFGDILLWVLPLVLIVGLFVWMSRRAAGPDGRGHEHRPQPGEGLQHREAEDDVRRRRRLRPGEAGDRRGRRLPQEPRQVQGDRRAHPEGRAARRSARHRQDAHRTRGRRRGRRAVRVGHRLRLHGDVRRRRRGARARPVPDRAQAGARDHLRRRDRLHRPQARRRARRRARRARADAQPDARRDGRLRGHRGHRDDGGHQPARRARPRAAAPRSLRPPDHGAAPHAGRAGARS